MRLFGRYEEGPNLTHVPPRKICVAAGLPMKLRPEGALGLEDFDLKKSRTENHNKNRTSVLFLFGSVMSVCRVEFFCLNTD